MFYASRAQADGSRNLVVEADLQVGLGRQAGLKAGLYEA
jgi:hypothetical protein